MAERWLRRGCVLQQVRRLNSPYVLCDLEGKSYSRDKVSMAFGRATTLAGIYNLRHDLRHDFASNLVQRGIDIHTVKELSFLLCPSEDYF